MLSRWDVTLSVLAVLVIGGLLAWQHYGNEKKHREESARRTEFESRISRFAESHNAVRDWQKSLGSKGRVYSAELAPVLVRQDGRPIFLFASIHDVSANEGKYLILVGDETTGSDLHLRLRLDCTPDQAHFVMSYPASDSFALVAQIQSVDSNEQVFRDSQAFYPFLLASGRCVDVMHISLEELLEFVIPTSLPTTY